MQMSKSSLTSEDQNHITNVFFSVSVNPSASLRECTPPWSTFFYNLRNTSAILLKIYHSKENLIANILKLKLPPHVTSMCRWSFFGTVRIYRRRFIGNNKDYATFWDLEVVST